MEVHLKEQTLLGLYLQYVDISEGCMVYSMCSCIATRIQNRILDGMKAHIKKEHFFFRLFDLGHRLGTINV